VFPDARPRPFQLGHTLFAQSLTDGRTRWRFRGDGYLDSTPLIVNRTVYVASAAGKLYGLSLRSGKVRWRTNVDLPVPAPLETGRVLSGLGAGERLLVVPTVRRLVAFRSGSEARRRHQR
jgi:glucose dehydrogenase